jgi:hypothetical protein
MIYVGGTEQEERGRGVQAEEGPGGGQHTARGHHHQPQEETSGTHNQTFLKISANKLEIKIIN